MTTQCDAQRLGKSRLHVGLVPIAACKPIWHGALSLLIVLPLALFSHPSRAEMYKCVSANGTQEFSDKPCGPDAQVHVVKLPGKSAAFDVSTSLHDDMPIPTASTGSASFYPVEPNGLRHAVRTRIVVVESKKAVTKESDSRHHKK